MLVVPLFYFLMVPAPFSTLLSPFPLEDTWTTLVLVATAPELGHGGRPSKPMGDIQRKTAHNSPQRAPQTVGALLA